MERQLKVKFIGVPDFNKARSQYFQLLKEMQAAAVKSLRVQLQAQQKAQSPAVLGKQLQAQMQAQQQALRENLRVQLGIEASMERQLPQRSCDSVRRLIRDTLGRIRCWRSTNSGIGVRGSSD